MRTGLIQALQTNHYKGTQDTLARSVDELQRIEFDKNDVVYMRTIGAQDVFQSGADALRFIKENGIKIGYGKFKDPRAHARWDLQSNTIFINSSYKGLTDHAGVLAISEAILHESGHAKDKDDKNSLQEELNCLALNVLAHRYHKKTHKGVFEGRKSPIFTEGVSLYEKLFFDFDPGKTALKMRMKDRYGMLNAGATEHPASKFTQSIKDIDLLG